MREFIRSKNFLISMLVIFFLFVGILQLFLKEDISKMTNGSMGKLAENKNLIEKVYLDWWKSSLDKVSSQGVKDIYEFKNTYENLNIVVKNGIALRDVVLNEIILDGKPLCEYEYETVNVEDKTIFKIPLKEFSDKNQNKLTKVIEIYNRYDNVFYKIDVDSFEFRFNFSKDDNFLYLNFENYISNFYDKEFKIETDYYSDNNQNFIYNFGHVNKNVKIPIVNNEKVFLNENSKERFFKENTSFILYNRFGVPFSRVGVLNSSELKILNTYNLSNVYNIELRNQVFTFQSQEDNIFEISKRKDGSVDIFNLIDNYGIYFDEKIMKTYKVYGDDPNVNRDELINFRIYRDLRDGNYIFVPNKSISLYKFYNFNEDKFLSYNDEVNKFVFDDESSAFNITKDNKIFDVIHRVFLKKDDVNNKSFVYIGEEKVESGDVFKFNNMNASFLKRVDYDEIQEEIKSGNYIQILLRNKETGEFLTFDFQTGEAINENLYKDSYLNGVFNYMKGINDLENFIFEIHPFTKELTSFSLYSRVTGTSLNIDYGFLNNKLIFDKSNNNKVKFFIEKNDGRDNEFKIKDDYGSYLSFNNSDNFAKVASNGIFKKILNTGEEFNIFEIYMISFEVFDEINSGFYISLSSKKEKEDIFLNKISSEDNKSELRSIDEYVVLKKREFIFLSGDSFLKDMNATIDYEKLKGIEKPLLSLKDEDGAGYRFRILEGVSNFKNIGFTFNVND